MADFELYPGLSSSGGLDFGTLPLPPAPKKPRSSKKKKLTQAQLKALVAAIQDPEDIKRVITLTEAGFTPRQALQAAVAMKEGAPRSFGARLAGIGKGALGGATWALDKLMRPSWAVTAATSEALGGKSDTKYSNPLSAAWGGFKGDVRKGFGQIMKEQGVLEGHSVLRGIAGFGADVVTDPVMLASLAAAPVTGGGSVAAYTAAKTAGRAVTPSVLKGAALEAGKRVAREETDEVLGEILKSAGKGYENRYALWQSNRELADLAPFTPGAKEAFEAVKSRQHILQETARKEERLVEPHSLGFRLGTTKHGFTLNTKVPLIMRPGKKIADLNLPILSQFVRSTGRAFTAFDDPMGHTAALGRQHVARTNFTFQRSTLARIFQGMDKKMTEDDMLNALHHFEMPLKTSRGGRWKAVVEHKTRPGHYKLNERYIGLLKKKGLLDDAGEDFVRRYHDATETLFALDKAAGVTVEHLGQTGRLYVPHVLMRGTDLEVPSIIQHGFLTKAGFQKVRSAEMSVKQIKEAVASGKYGDDLVGAVETDPFKLLGKRTRAGAEKQADMALLNTLKATVGVPSKIVNPKTVAQATARITKAEKALGGGRRAAAQAEEEYEEAIELFKSGLVDVHNKATREIQKGITEARTIARTKQTQKLKNQLADLEKRLKRARKPETISKLQNEVDEIQKTLDVLKRRRVMTPAIVKAEAQKVSLRQSLDDALADLSNPRTKAHKEAMAPKIENLKAAEDVIKQAKRDIKNARAQLKRATQGKKNPAVRGRKAELGEVSGAADEYGNPILFDKEARRILKAQSELISGEAGSVRAFGEGLTNFMGAWKVLVTTVNPGYRFRNTLTDFWNMWVAGVPAWAIGRYGIKAATLMRAFKNPGSKHYIEAEQLMREAGHHGILSGLFAGDVQQWKRFVKYEGRSKAATAKEGRLLSAGTQLAQDVNRNAENWGRLIHYLYRRKALKESASDAAFRVKIAHFDYEDLTPFEQKVMKNIFPFYTWTRKNIPYQVRQMVAQPGRFSAFPKAAQEAQYAAVGEGESGLVAPYVEEQFGIPLGGNWYGMPQFGVSDLSVFQNPLSTDWKENTATRRIAQQLTPLAKVPAELLSGISLFTGQPIESEHHPLAPISERGASILGAIPGVETGRTSRAIGGGKYQETAGVNPWVNYFAGQLPMARTILGVGAATEEKQKQQLLSYLAGLSTQHQDPEQQAYYQSIEIMSDTDKFLAGLRDAGVYPRTPKKVSDIDKLLELILRSNYSG